VPDDKNVEATSPGLDSSGAESTDRHTKQNHVEEIKEAAARPVDSGKDVGPSAQR
jgi:hypothetical protein